MDTTVLIMLLIATALAMPAWMAWRKAKQRPRLGGWLLTVGLLILPFGLTFWLHPEWLAHPVPFLAKYLVLMPAFLALSALGGGLVYLLGPLSLALLLVIGKAFGEVFKDAEWRQDDEEEVNPFDEYDWNNPRFYEYELDRINSQYGSEDN